MNSYINKVGQFLSTSTVWMFFAILLFASIVLVSGSAERTWPVYYFYLGIMVVIFAPILLFSGFRPRLKAQLNQAVFYLLWGVIFVVYPLLLLLLKVEQYVSVSNINLNEWFIPIIGSVLLLVELIILSQEQLLKKVPGFAWVKRIYLERGILVALLILAFGLTFFEMVFGGQMDGKGTLNLLFFINFSLQLFLIFFIYYIFYWINHYVLIKRVFKQKGIVYYAFSFTATLFLLFPVAAQMISWLPIVHEYQMHPIASTDVFDGIHFIIPLMGMLLTTPIILVVNWFEQNNEITSLEKEKTDTELRLLKQQINPHFFFNTLNNLYALSLTKDEKTPEVIMQLSELMRYVIKRGKEEVVPIKEEIQYIEDYVRLQKIRLHKQLAFTFDIEVEDQEIEIPPLLFINLVENAFKHGIEPAEENCKLHLYLKCSNKELYFECLNSLEEKTENKHGTGLKNLRRRLALRFPEKHELQTVEGGDSYKAILKITL